VNRRTLDFIFAGGGVLIGVMLLVLGYVLADQASFAESYVKTELSDQKITFKTADTLTPEEKSWKPGSSCLTANAGKLMQAGKQAECYASFFIALHMDTAAKAAGYEGATYATMGDVQTTLRAEIAAAKAKSDTTAADAAQKKLDAATGLRSTFQTGETLRGLLLTSYGFSVFGEKAALASNVCYLGALLLVLLGVAGFVHAFKTPREKWVGVSPTAAIPGAS
jgi:hypothetical protein